ncbi:hypothetical protein PHMEG_00012951 [Phytophthora megakarya]|uniref:Uncharacterized protein n=1 Tax=Phytophthora megakarya TaxID=4795 RepID=A0A225W7I3_9STRA|nr:hypothetical protein PHMEG_00012951 [Phytophthora megakarya]
MPGQPAGRRWITTDHYEAGKIELVLEWRVGSDRVARPD